MPFLYGGSNAGVPGQGGASAVSFSLQNSFSADVALGNVPGVRSFVNQSRDAKTAQVNPPRFVIDIAMDDRTNLTANTTLYISSDNAADVGQVVVVDGISIVDIGGTNKLKEVFGFAVTNGLSQVAVTELGTGSPLGFFRINTAVNAPNVPFAPFQGNIYLAEIDSGGSPSLGIPANSNIQDVVSLATDFTSSPASYGFSQSGSFTIPQVLVTGEVVTGMVISRSFIMPDDTAQVYTEINTFNGDGAITNIARASSFQSGSPNGLVFDLANLFFVSPGTEFKLYATLGSNNQTIVIVTIGTLYFTPL